jgi:hypothetical protein
VAQRNLGVCEYVRDNVEDLGYERKIHFTRIRPTVKEETVYIGADVKKKEGQKSEQVAGGFH